MKKRVAFLLGFMAFGLVGYIGGQARDEQPRLVQSEQFQSRLEALERAWAGRADCECIRIPKGSREVEIGGIHFYLVPVSGDAGKVIRP